MKKCSLAGLEQRRDLEFYPYPRKELPYLTGYILLTLDAPPLTIADRDHGLLFLDGTWKNAEKMFGSLPNKEQLQMRSIPSHCRTAYPRKQTACTDPERGLATVEALYLAYDILDREVEGLLDFYYWKELFYQKNPHLEKRV